MTRCRVIIYCIITFIIPVCLVYAGKSIDISEPSYWKNITVADIKNILSSDKQILNSETESNCSFFKYAIMYSKDINVICYLIEQSGNLKYEYGDDSPLFLAIAANSPLNIVRKLINAGVKVNETDMYGLTPLMHALENGNIPIIELLLDCGADLNVVDSDGYGLECYASGWIINTDVYKKRIAPFAKRSLPKSNAFWHNATLNDVRELAKSGYDFNQNFRYDTNVLMIAVETTNNPDIINELIKHVSDINYISEYGDKNALSFAIDAYEDNNKLPVIEALIKAGVSANIVNLNDDTVLSTAFYKGTPELIELLLNHDAKLPNKFNKKDLLKRIENNESGLKYSDIYKKRILPLIQSIN